MQSAKHKICYGVYEMTGYMLRKRCAEVRLFVVMTLSRLLTAIKSRIYILESAELYFEH